MPAKFQRFIAPYMEQAMQMHGDQLPRFCSAGHKQVVFARAAELLGEPSLADFPQPTTKGITRRQADIVAVILGLDRNESKKFLRNCEDYILPSDNKLPPVNIAEARAAINPVVEKTMPGVREFVREAVQQRIESGHFTNQKMFHDLLVESALHFRQNPDVLAKLGKMPLADSIKDKKLRPVALMPNERLIVASVLGLDENRIFFKLAEMEYEKAQERKSRIPKEKPMSLMERMGSVAYFSRPVKLNLKNGPSQDEQRKARLQARTAKTIIPDTDEISIFDAYGFINGYEVKSNSGVRTGQYVEGALDRYKQMHKDQSPDSEPWPVAEKRTPKQQRRRVAKILRATREWTRSEFESELSRPFVPKEVERSIARPALPPEPPAPETAAQVVSDGDAIVPAITAAAMTVAAATHAAPPQDTPAITPACAGGWQERYGIDAEQAHMDALRASGKNTAHKAPTRAISPHNNHYSGSCGNARPQKSGYTNNHKASTAHSSIQPHSAGGYTNQRNNIRPHPQDAWLHSARLAWHDFPPRNFFIPAWEGDVSVHTVQDYIRSALSSPTLCGKGRRFASKEMLFTVMEATAKRFGITMPDMNIDDPNWKPDYSMEQFKLISTVFGMHHSRSNVFKLMVKIASRQNHGEVRHEPTTQPTQFLRPFADSYIDLLNSMQQAEVPRR